MSAEESAGRRRRSHKIFIGIWTSRVHLRHVRGPPNIVYPAADAERSMEGHRQGCQPKTFSMLNKNRIGSNQNRIESYYLTLIAVLLDFDKKLSQLYGFFCAITSSIHQR